MSLPHGDFILAVARRFPRAVVPHGPCEWSCWSPPVPGSPAPLPPRWASSLGSSAAPSAPASTAAETVTHEWHYSSRTPVDAAVTIRDFKKTGTGVPARSPFRFPAQPWKASWVLAHRAGLASTQQAESLNKAIRGGPRCRRQAGTPQRAKWPQPPGGMD